MRKQASLHESIFVLGEDTREHIVSHQQCPALDHYGIAVAGVSEARTPYHIVRPALWHQEVQVCFGGHGTMRVGTNFRKFGFGVALLSPLGATQAFYAVRGVTWCLAWVHYFPHARYLSKSKEPTAFEVDPEPLRSAITALYREATSRSDASVSRLLAEWVHLEAMRVARRKVPDQRLEEVFRVVDARLAQDWNLAALARLAGMSREQFRRLCQTEYNQSPMERVRAMRMARAAAMLSDGTDKMDAIALELGYSSPYAFSTAFKRVFGRAPSRAR
jgi:AraC-like DNA-binding protein